ncbi:MAG: STAS domain-containing protein [Actinomycetota bacterium]
MAGPKESPTIRVGAVPTPPEPSTMVLVISGHIGRADIDPLCEQVCGWLNGCGSDRIVCDVREIVDPDAAALDALARLQLAARRSGREIRLRHASTELRELLVLTGLSDAVPLCGELVLEPGRETEEREQARGVEEEGDPGDPTA